MIWGLTESPSGSVRAAAQRPPFPRALWQMLALFVHLGRVWTTTCWGSKGAVVVVGRRSSVVVGRRCRSVVVRRAVVLVVARPRWPFERAG